MNESKEESLQQGYMIKSLRFTRLADKNQNFFVVENLYMSEGFLIKSFVERPSASKRSWEFVLHVQLLLVKQLRDELQFCFSGEMLC